MKLVVISFFILFVSCSQVEPQEILILQEIIKRDFKNCPTYHKLIPINVQPFKTYQEYKKDGDQIKSTNKPRTAEAPSAYETNPRINVPIGYLPFSRLIRNAQISEGQYARLIKECKLVDGIIDEIHTNQIVTEDFEKIMSTKSVNQYQEFGYPILSGDTIIIYKNFYTGIKSSDKLGLNGYGIYFVYSKIDQEWIQTHKVTKWIT